MDQDQTDSTGDVITDDDSENDDFNKAAAFLPQVMAKKLTSNEDLLYLYARYKRVTAGLCDTKRPGFFEMQARKKWDAWKSVSEMSVNDARTEYIQRMLKLDPSWKNEKGTNSKVKPATSSWVTVSTMAYNKDAIPDEQKTVFDYCQEGDLITITKHIKHSSINIDALDDGGMSLLHWACDLGHIDIVKLLMQHKANVNVIDSEGQTPLHSACACGHAVVVQLLLDNNVDPTIENKEGERAADLVGDEAVKQLLASHT